MSLLYGRTNRSATNNLTNSSFYVRIIIDFRERETSKHASRKYAYRGRLILGKISKFDATRYQILRLKMHLRTNLSNSASPSCMSGTCSIGSIDSPLSSSITPSLFHSRLKTFLFCMARRMVCRRRRKSTSSSLLQQQGPSWPSAWRQERKPIWHLSSTVSRHSCQGVQSVG